MSHSFSLRGCENADRNQEEEKIVIQHEEKEREEEKRGGGGEEGGGRRGILKWQEVLVLLPLFSLRALK